jgi:hypothetical protein
MMCALNPRPSAGYPWSLFVYRFAPRPSCIASSRIVFTLYMTVQGMMQHEQSSVLKQEHLPPWGLTMEPAAEEMEEVVEAGIVALTFE